MDNLVELVAFALVVEELLALVLTLVRQHLGQSLPVAPVLPVGTGHSLG